MKYKLTEKTIVYEGRTLYQIQALKEIKTDLLDVKVGQCGGFVEGVHNLSQEGNCWIHPEARVYEQAIVRNDAQILHQARVYGAAIIQHQAVVEMYANVFGRASVNHRSVISGRAAVYDSASINDFATVEGSSKVYGSARMRDRSRILGQAELCERAEVLDSASIFNHAKVYGKAIICDVASVYDYAEVFDKAVISGIAEISDNARVFKYINISDDICITSTVSVPPIILRGISKLLEVVIIMDTHMSIDGFVLPISKWFTISDEELFQYIGLDAIEQWELYKPFIREICESERPKALTT